MNNTARAATRKKYDQYFTPPWVARVLLHYVDDIEGPIGEPCAGAGHIAAALADAGHTVAATEYDPDLDPTEYPDTVCGIDFFGDVATEIYDGIPWIVTNPPYSSETGTAAQCFRRATELASVGVAMLMRLAWLEPCADRKDLLPSLSEILVLANPRVEFLGVEGGGNPGQSAWMIWRAEDPYGPAIRWADPDVCEELGRDR